MVARKELPIRDALEADAAVDGGALAGPHRQGSAKPVAPEVRTARPWNESLLYYELRIAIRFFHPASEHKRDPLDYLWLQILPRCMAHLARTVYSGALMAVCF